MKDFILVLKSKVGKKESESADKKLTEILSRRVRYYSENKSQYNKELQSL